MKHLLFICRLKNKQGFTLVETLVVVTIFSIVAIGIAASFVSGAKLWDRAKNTDFSKAEFLLDMEKVTRQLRQSVNTNEIKFDGASQEVSFPGFADNSVKRIVYIFDSSQKALLRREYNPESDLETYTETTALSSLDEFSFSYLQDTEDGFEWLDSWDEDSGIFSAIKLQGKFKNEDFVKTVFIPIS